MKLRRALGWAVATVVLVGCAFELGVRAFVRLDALVYQDSQEPGLSFELKPGARGEKVGAFVEINAQGLRERDVPFAKPADEFRIVVVGDHPTFGLGVPVEQVYARLLESKVPPVGRKQVRTINVSMYSYTLLQKLELLRLRGMQYQPDFVVFQVTPRDLDALPPVLFHTPVLKNWIRSNCYSCRWISERLFWQRSSPPGPPGLPQAEVITRQLAALQDLVSHRFGIPILVVFCPDLSETPSTARTYEETRREYAAASKKLGIPFEDLSPALRRQPASRMLLRPAQPWLSAAGHEVAAKAVAAEIRRILERRRAAQRPRV